MMKIDESIFQTYINHHNEHIAKYGEKTIVLMMVGSFYELYSVFEQGPDLIAISQLLNIVCTRKSKNLPESIKNPKMMGFQMNSLEKFLEILTNNNYTVVVYDQFDSTVITEKKKIRKIVGIYTKSININNIQKNNNNYLLCIYINNNVNLKSVGLSCVDLSTGQVIVFSSYSDKYDEYLALDNTLRFMNNIMPGEILIYGDGIKENKEFLYNYLNINLDKCYYSNTIENKYKNLKFQNEFFKNIYPTSNTLLTPIEQLNLEREPHICISLCLLFDFVNDKMPSFLKNIKYPEMIYDNTHLVLENNAVQQLDIFENAENHNIKSKYKSLFNVINETLTPMGERYLRNLLASPHIDSTKLNQIYENTEKLQKINLIPNLKEICDIERLSRKLELKIIKPYEIVFLLSSYENIVNICQILKKDFKYLLPEDNFKNKVKKCIKHVNQIFDIEKLGLCSDLNFTINIYQPNIHEDIDNLQTKIHSGKESIEYLKGLLSNYLNSTNSSPVCIKNTVQHGNHIFSSNKHIINFLNSDIIIPNGPTILVKDITINQVSNGVQILTPLTKHNDLVLLKNYLSSLNLIDNKIKIKNNSQDGYYLCLTANNANILKTNLNKLDLDLDLGYKKIKVSDLEFKYNKDTVKIIIPSLNEHADKLEEYSDEIKTIYKSYYLSDIEYIYNKYQKLFNICNEFVTKIDYLNSCTILSLKKGYTKPIIDNKSYSYINATKLRHPIVERLIEYEYIPHDISIGNPN